METFFENRYERTMEFHKEIVTHTMIKSPGALIGYIPLGMLLIISIMSLISPGTLPIHFSNTSAVRNISFFAILTAYIIARYIRAPKNDYKRDIETNNGEPMKVEMALTNDGVGMYSVNQDAKAHIPYKSVTKIITTKNYYGLLTEAKQIMFFKKDGFVKGSPDEFLPFIKSKVTERTSKRKMLIGIACFACVIIALIYWNYGRTIFEDRSFPTEEEWDTIVMILEHERAKLIEFTELLLPYADILNELDVQIHPVLQQRRAINHRGTSEIHDWESNMWLPRYYRSLVACFIYKDGKPLLNPSSGSSPGYFVEHYWVVHAIKNEPVVFFEDPFKNFDENFNKLLNEVSDYQGALDKSLKHPSFGEFFAMLR